jgi:hypothetical protein
MQCSEIRSRLKVGVALIWCDTLSEAGIEFGGGDNVCRREQSKASPTHPPARPPIVCVSIVTLSVLCGSLSVRIACRIARETNPCIYTCTRHGGGRRPCHFFASRYIIFFLSDDNLCLSRYFPSSRSRYPTVLFAEPGSAKKR